MAGRRSGNSKPLRTEPNRSDRPPARAAYLSAAYLSAAALALVTLGAFSNSLDGVLVLDDIRAVERNQTIQSSSPLSGALSPPTATTLAGRPIANLSFALDHRLAQGSVRGYHRTNLLIHLLAGLVLFGVVRRTLATDSLRAWAGADPAWPAAAMAAVWLVHPLQTESVTYVVQRVESLAGLFYLLTVYAAIRAWEPRGRGVWTATAVAACALGVATKEVVVTAPIIVALWDWCFAPAGSRRARWGLLAGLGATWVLLGALVFNEHRAPSIDLAGATVWRYALTQTGVVLHYLRLSIVPAPLVFLYDWPLASSVTDVTLAVIAIAALAGATAFAIGRRHPLGFVGAWFFVILGPTSTVLPIVTEVAAEHRMYLPLAAVVGAASWILGVLITTLTGRFVAGAHRSRANLSTTVAITIALVATFGSLTRARNADYHSAERLWATVVDAQPANVRARVAYGEALASAGRVGEAESQYWLAVERAPDDPVALVRLGSVLAARGRMDEALRQFEHAASIAPDDLDARRGLGLALAARRDDARAVIHLGFVLAARPDDLVAIRELVAILTASDDPSLRDPPRALALATHAVALTARRDPLSLELLSAALASVGRYTDAAAAGEEGAATARALGDQALAARLTARASAYREAAR